MLKKIFASLIFLFIVWIFFWAVFIPKESLNQRVSREMEHQKRKIDLFMKGVTFSEIIDGRKYWEIKAVTSQINKDSGIALLSDINGYFFRNGKPSIKFIAPSVEWDMKKKEIVINSPKGQDNNYKFAVPDLRWSMDRKKVWTDGDVTLSSAGGSINGRGLLGDIELSKMTIMGSPKAAFASKGRKIDITADAFEIYGAAGDLSAIGNAKAMMGELLVSAESIRFFKAKEDVLAAGGVDVSFKDIKARADFARFNLKGNVVMLSGNAKASRYGSQMAGGKLKIDMRNNKILLEGKTEVFVEEEDLENNKR